MENEFSKLYSSRLYVSEQLRWKYLEIFIETFTAYKLFFACKLNKVLGNGIICKIRKIEILQLKCKPIQNYLYIY